MKLVKKSDLRQIGNRIVDLDGYVLSLPAVEHDANEVFEIIDLVDFIVNNKGAIIASTSEPVVYTPHKADKPRFTPVPDAPTPAIDEHAEKTAAIAEEWLAKRNNEDVNTHLARYGALAKFMAHDYIELSNGNPSSFEGDIFELTEADVVDAVILFHDPEMLQLRKKIDIRF